LSSQGNGSTVGGLPQWPGRGYLAMDVHFLSTSDFVSYNPKDSILWIFLLDTLGILVQSTFLAPLFERTDFAVLSRADKITPSQLGGGYFEF